MKTNATQRTLKVLRDNGWTACVVERWLAHAKPYGKRVDAFGFGDILAVRPAMKLNSIKITESRIVLVQCCPGDSHAKHKTKILALEELKTWKAAGGIAMLVSWSRRGPRGARKHWVMREEQL